MAASDDDTPMDDLAADDQKPSPPSSPSSSSSSDSDDDDEAADALKIQALEAAIAQNPNDYDSHVAYIQCLRKSGQLDKLRHARESMNERFPLSTKMWQEWIKDEVSLCTSSEAVAKIEKLYEFGVQEYLSVSLWLDYINFLQEHDEPIAQCTEAGITKMRNLFERAVTAAGLHITEGNKIWEAYRTFEEAITLTIDETNVEEKEKQFKRIRDLYHRQLSVPLVDLKSILRDYKNWEIQQGNLNDLDSEFDGVPSEVVPRYRRALDLYSAREQYENQISQPEATEAEKLKQFMNYIKFEESSGDPARVQILYERAVAEFPISSELWLGYTNYVDRTFKVSYILKNVHSRATRNCTWVGDLWVRQLLSMERINASEKELSEVFEQAVQCVFPSFKEYLELFLTRVDGLRRRISTSGQEENGLHFSLIRDVFQRAIEYFSPEVLSSEDLLHVHAYWARLEAVLAKDFVASRGVWESLIKKSGSTLEIWQAYIAMEIELGQIREARSIYKRCYSKRFPGTGSEAICHSWLQFEREFGTLDDYDLAVKKVTPRLQELQVFKTQQESQNDVIAEKKENSFSTNVQHKRKSNNVLEDKQPMRKKKKHTSNTVESVENDRARVKDEVQNAEELAKGDTEKLAKAADADENAKEHLGSSKTKEPKPSRYNDECTAFISNISLEAKDEDLRQFFSDCGGVVAIRLLKDKFTGKSRGLAYVDFSNEEHLAAAIGKNKQKFFGKKVSIARSNPKQGQRRGSFDTDSSSGRMKQTGIAAHSSGGSRTKMDLSEANVKDKHGRREKVTTSVTFAAPRNVAFAVPRAVIKPPGSSKKEAQIEQDSETPKSNDEFRDMLLKK